MPEYEAEFWIELAPGKAMRIRALVVEEASGQPLEVDRHRLPDMNETLNLLDGIGIGAIRRRRPF